MSEMDKNLGLDLEAAVATPRGFRRFGDLIVDDKVCDGDGDSSTVREIQDSEGLCDCVEVIFDDITSLVAGADQWWLTADDGVVTTLGLQHLLKGSRTVSILPGGRRVRTVRSVDPRMLRQIRTDKPWFLAGRRAAAVAAMPAVQASV